MFDTGRQSFTDKMESTLKPDSQQSLTEEAGDKIKRTMGSSASIFQPNSQKSDAQRMGDVVSSSNRNQNEDSLLNKAKAASMGMGGNSS